RKRPQPGQPAEPLFPEPLCGRLASNIIEVRASRLGFIPPVGSAPFRETTMNRHQKGTKRRRQILRLWTRAQALEALPYVRSIVRSPREPHLEVLRHRRDARRLADRPGRPDREALIAHQEALQGEARASQGFQHSLDELQSLDVYCLDPVRGEALIPF